MRTCDGQMYDGADCSALDGGNDSRACNVSADGAWSAWGACSGNDGQEMRTCDGQMYDGADCSALDGGNDSRDCQVVCCVAVVQRGHVRVQYIPT